MRILPMQGVQRVLMSMMNFMPNLNIFSDALVSKNMND